MKLLNECKESEGKERKRESRGANQLHKGVVERGVLNRSGAQLELELQPAGICLLSKKNHTSYIHTCIQVNWTIF